MTLSRHFLLPRTPAIVVLIEDIVDGHPRIALYQLFKRVSLFGSGHNKHGPTPLRHIGIVLLGPIAKPRPKLCHEHFSVPVAESVAYYLVNHATNVAVSALLAEALEAEKHGRQPASFQLRIWVQRCIVDVHLVEGIGGQDIEVV